MSGFTHPMPAIPISSFQALARTRAHTRICRRNANHHGSRGLIDATRRDSTVPGTYCTGKYRETRLCFPVIRALHRHSLLFSRARKWSRQQLHIGSRKIATRNWLIIAARSTQERPIITAINAKFRVLRWISILDSRLISILCDRIRFAFENTRLSGFSKKSMRDKRSICDDSERKMSQTYN